MAGRRHARALLKFENRRFKHLVANELLTMRFAAALGLPTSHATARAIAGRRRLVLERYDRYVDGEGRVQRLHQEDLCQALGLVPTFYDLVCTGVYPRLSQSSAMTVGASADPCFIRGRDWAELADRMKASPRFVTQRVRDLLERAPDTFEAVAAEVDAELGGAAVIQLARRRMRKNVRSLRARLAE